MGLELFEGKCILTKEEVGRVIPKIITKNRYNQWLEEDIRKSFRKLIQLFPNKLIKVIQAETGDYNGFNRVDVEATLEKGALGIRFIKIGNINKVLELGVEAP